MKGDILRSDPPFHQQRMSSGTMSTRWRRLYYRADGCDIQLVDDAMHRRLQIRPPYTILCRLDIFVPGQRDRPSILQRSSSACERKEATVLAIFD